MFYVNTLVASSLMYNYNQEAFFMVKIIRLILFYSQNHGDILYNENQFQYMFLVKIIW